MPLPGGSAAPGYRPGPLSGRASFTASAATSITPRRTTARRTRYGHDPVPGIALLELARGDAPAAVVTIGRALQEYRKPLERPALLAAAVEIRRAAGDPGGARAAAGELAAVAAGGSSAVLRAMAAHALGTVLAGEGDVVAALAELRTAAAAWRSLGMPYEAARTAVAVGLACAAMGDGVAAALELGTARDAFARLGARPDIERLDMLISAGVRGRVRPLIAARACRPGSARCWPGWRPARPTGRSPRPW